MIKSQDVTDVLDSLVTAGDDSTAFADAAKRIDWAAAGPGDCLRAVHLALSAGAHLTARELAMRGAERFSGDPELAKAARVLAPPMVRPASPTGRTSFAADRQWLLDHRQEYRGQWVALRAGRLLACALTARELRRLMEPTAGVLMTRVP